MGVGHWGHGVGVGNLGHSVGVDLGHGVGNWGDSGPHGGNGSNTNIGGRDQVGNSVGNWSSHNSLADGVDKTILVQVLGEALKRIGAEALWGLDCVSKGRSEGADWNTRVDMGGGGSKPAGKERRQDK